MELQELLRAVSELTKKLNEVRGYLDISKIEEKIEELNQNILEPDFWSDNKRAASVNKELDILRSKIEKDKELKEMIEELETYQMLLEEEGGELLVGELAAKHKRYEKLAEKTEVEFILNDDYDTNDAILTIHSGAGGTESQDWAEMLLRMYTRWAEAKGFSHSIDDILDGEEAGIKSVTMEISGSFAYGFLKSETGIHRLVRISPFNAQGKRQTSFASVFVYPIVDDDIDLDINPSDLKIDTYRASGAGGQHVNTTDSAVRITHIPTNIIVQCQKERSQIKNRETAMKLLRSRLYKHYEEQKQKEKQAMENQKTEIGWGNQIRSYVFHPYQMVKDHRTNFEIGNMDSVMEGELDGFIYNYLKNRALERKNKTL
ncbi:MAG: peptide chain release factor 2 [Candidatus Cloacimonas sp.]|nr:peptide chain release factor 2 [Candidatus Cloacimonadota bacterium]